MVKRKNRKSFIHENGVENYDFDFNKEIRRYLFFCGEQMTRKQWKLLKSDEKFYSYTEWKSYVKNKYSNYPVEGLREFSRYLNHRLRKTSPTREFISPCVSAICSCILTFHFTEIFNKEFDNLTMIVGIITIFVIAACFSSNISWLVVKISELFFDNSIKENFFKDYKEIIDSIIKEKV